MVTVRPSEFLAIVNKPEYSLGTKIVNTYIRLPILLVRLLKYITIDGTLSKDFCSDLAAIDCTPPEEATA